MPHALSSVAVMRDSAVVGHMCTITSVLILSKT